MHNVSPMYHVLSDPLQLFPAQLLRDVCLKVTPPVVFRSPPHSLALRVPRQRLSRNVGVWLSRCMAKPSPSFLKNVNLYLNLACPLPEFLVADFVHSLYSQYFPQALIYKSLDPFQRGLVHSPSFCSI